MRLAALVLIAFLGVVLGSQASAWRRASVRLAERAKIYRSLTGSGLIPEDGLAVSEAMIQEFEPPFVAWRKRTAGLLLLLVFVLAWMSFGWIWALVTFVASLAITELFRILTLPRPDSSYFLVQLLDNFERRARAAGSLKEEEALQLLEKARILRCLLDGDTKREPPAVTESS